MWMLYAYSMLKLYILIQCVNIYRIQNLFDICKKGLFFSVPTFDEKVNIHNDTYFKYKM